MLGVRFLDADFMRINLACGCPTVKLICFSCTVVKGRKRHRVGKYVVPLAAWPSPYGNASKSSGRACASPLGGGRAKIENSSRRHPRKFGQKRFLAVTRSWRGNGVACFWATSLEKIFGGVTAIISFRPGGRMQQSAVPDVLSFRSG